MLKALFKFIFKFNKWSLHQPCPPEANNCIMVAAPHTSNWDFVYAITALDQLGLNPRFTIKKEFNKFLLGGMIRGLGALWIDRTPKDNQKGRLSMTQVMVSMFEEAKEPLLMLVTAEGTRTKVEEWKTGFYYTAIEAKVPICLAYMDYEKKKTGVGMCFMPNGDINADMKIIMDYYSDKVGKFPVNFALDKRYS
jgi:1-acyl-sn-glycerol-3-phosphate acyltransferase